MRDSLQCTRHVPKNTKKNKKIKEDVNELITR
jgi:hypothetical protein